MNTATERLPTRRLSLQAALDMTRPHRLEGTYRMDAAVLRFRYTDTGEQVCVPNTWNNRPPEQRLQDDRQHAAVAEQRAAQLEVCPPSGIDPAAVQTIVAHYRQKAARLRASTGQAAATGPAI